MANKYVRAGAGGTGSGDDWTNAYTSIPSPLTRGDTYYIADGSYGSYSFDDAVSGTTLITVKKATAADHGIETGWVSTYGDGVADFTGWTISTSYWVIDGQVGGGPDAWDSGHGFRVYVSSSDIVTLLNTISNITIAHTEIEGNRDGSFQAGIKATTGVSSYVTVSYCTIKNTFGPQFHVKDWSNIVIEYCYVYANKSTPADHSEAISCFNTNTDWVIRWSLWDKIEGTAVFAGISDGTSTNWQMYGNIFSRSQTTLYYYTDASNDNQMYDSEFFNNTIVGQPGNSMGCLIVNTGSGNTAYNNIFYDNDANLYAWSFTHDYTYADSNIRSADGPFDKDAEIINGEANGWSENGDPFTSYNVDPLIADFTPSAAFFDSNPGFDTGGLITGNDVDMNGIIRGADGTWDRGAVEYGTQTPTPTSSIGVFIMMGM